MFTAINSRQAQETLGDLVSHPVYVVWVVDGRLYPGRLSWCARQSQSGASPQPNLHKHARTMLVADATKRLFVKRLWLSCNREEVTRFQRKEQGGSNRLRLSPSSHGAATVRVGSPSAAEGDEHPMRARAHAVPAGLASLRRRRHGLTGFRRLQQTTIMPFRNPPAESRRYPGRVMPSSNAGSAHGAWNTTTDPRKNRGLRY